MSESLQRRTSADLTLTDSNCLGSPKTHPSRCYLGDVRCEILLRCSMKLGNKAMQRLRQSLIEGSVAGPKLRHFERGNCGHGEPQAR
jgi:hypothetical protein